MAVIGAVIYDARAIHKIELLRPEHFHLYRNELIFDFVLKSFNAGKSLDERIILAHFASNDTLAEIGGADYIQQAIEQAAFGPEIKDYAEIIIELSSRRALAAGLKDANDGVYGDTPIDAIIQSVTDGINALNQATSKGEWVSSGVEAVNAIVSALEGGESAKARYGIPALDQRTGGLYGGDLVIMAGRPSMGKTAAANFIGSAQDSDKVVGVFNLEMTNEQQGQRFASAQYLMATGCQLPYTDIRRGYIPGNERFIEQFKYAMEQAPEVFWRSMPRASFQRINSAARELKRMKGRLDLLVIDYLQLMDFHQSRNGNRSSDIGDATSQLKALAIDLDIPILLLSQLSRGVEQRDNKRPMLSDLRDSGSIEQDADVVHFCFREHYYLEREGEPKTSDRSKIEEYEMRLIQTQNQFLMMTPKLRMGKIGDDLIYWDAAHGVFYPDQSMNLESLRSAVQ